MFFAKGISMKECEVLTFASRDDFRAFLSTHAGNDGIWLLFGKTGGPVTLRPDEALEEALCFGWIDGLLKKIDDVTYKKYFALRKPGSLWSEKNRKLALELMGQGKMTSLGIRAMEDAKARGTWDSPKDTVPGDEEIEEFGRLLVSEPLAYDNFLKMPKSVRRTYAMHYQSARQEVTRNKRLGEIIDRLNHNKLPM
jgi:uncharacterized protein YdeI (YjbR/CyaY-like superfamily)